MIIRDKDELFRILRQKHKGDKFVWNDGFPGAGKADAQEVGQHIENLAIENNGLITTQMLVEDSDNLQSPLYPIVEHDMEVAATNWRKYEVRKIAGALIIVKVISDGEDGEEPETIRVRLLHNVTDGDGERGYTSTYIAPHINDYQQQIVDDLTSALLIWQRKAREYEKFSSIVEAIDLAIG